MCCEPKWGHHSPMVGFQSFGCGCTSHRHPSTPEEEKAMLERYKGDLEDELSRVEARIKRMKKTKE